MVAVGQGSNCLVGGWRHPQERIKPRRESARRAQGGLPSLRTTPLAIGTLCHTATFPMSAWTDWTALELSAQRHSYAIVAQLTPVCTLTVVRTCLLEDNGPMCGRVIVRMARGKGCSLVVQTASTSWDRPHTIANCRGVASELTSPTAHSSPTAVSATKADTINLRFTPPTEPRLAFSTRGAN